MGGTRCQVKVRRSEKTTQTLSEVPVTTELLEKQWGGQWAKKSNAARKERIFQQPHIIPEADQPV